MVDEISVLHVDDEPDFADMAARFLTRENNQISVTTAHHANEALDVIQEHSVDCVISDYDMPEQNGIELLEEVRDRAPDLPFILYTGKGSEEIASEAITAGVTDYIQKQAGTTQYAVLANRIQNTVEQYRSRRAVEETEEKLTQLADRTKDILFMFDSDWTELLFINSAYEEVWNRSIAELEEHPRSFLNNVHPDDKELVEQTLERILAGQPTEVEHRLEDEDGVRWIHSKANPIFDDDGNFTRIVGFVRDITERAEYEQQLEQQREQYRYVEEAADIGYWELDTQTPEPHDVMVSEGVYRVHELSHDEPFDVEKSLEFYHPEDRQRIRELVEQALADGEPYEFEARLITATGTERWVHAAGEPVERDGEVVKIRGVFQDITERKHHELELTRQNERLEKFASIVSHDLRNPLNVMEGRLELLKEESDSEHFDPMNTAIDRINRIIGDVLWLAREGQDIGTTAPVSVKKTVEAAWNMVADGNERAEVQVDCDEPLPTINADEDRFKQLLENLLRNAIQHGGEAVTVRVGRLDDGFYIEDDGPGIPADVQEQVFDVGYSSRVEGTGFGLNIVQQVAEAHGWEIQVTDGTDGGARFEITGVEIAH